MCKSAQYAVLSAVVWLGTAPAFAQAPMARVEFDEAVRLALSKNPTVASAATTITRAEALLQQASTVRRPSVSAGLTSLTLDREVGFSGQVTQPRHQATFAGTVSMTVLAPARWAAIAQARDQVDVARIEVEEVRQQVAVAAAQTYLAVISQRRLVEVTTRSLNNARAHVQYAQARLAAGAGTRLNELRASQSVSVDEVRLETARLALRRAQEALGVILAADGPVDAGAEPRLEAPPPGAVTLEDTAWMADRPDVKRQMAQMQAARRVVDDSRRDWFPTGTAAFDPRYITPAGLFQPSRTWRLTLSFSQPLFDGGQRRATRALRQSTVDALTLGLTLLHIEARADARLAQAAVESAERALVAAARAAEQANEVLRITTLVFEVGAATNIEVIDAQRSARDAEAVAAQTEDALRQARLDLLVALGRFPR